jgi:hypothetical protein
MIEESIKNIVQSMSRTSTIPARILTTRRTTPAALPLGNGDGHPDIDPEREAAMEEETAEKETVGVLEHPGPGFRGHAVQGLRRTAGA